MQTDSYKIRFTRASGLLLSLVSAALLVGCSAKHQQRSGTVIGYYPSERSSPYASGYRALDPVKGDGAANMHDPTLRSYSALGKRYQPQIRPIGWKESGMASWYGAEFHGKKTASGETYNMYAPGTAAHKTLPMNTIVLVTHNESGARVKARINDRGPFVAGRIIDLSYTAGKAIGLDKTGTAPVTIEVLEYDAHIAARLGGDAQEDDDAAKTPKETGGAFVVQLGAFRSMQSANRLKNDAQKKTPNRVVSIKTVKSGGEDLYRVLIDGFESKEEATRFKDSLDFPNALVAGDS
ncbi:MAG: septal ring lytic transglycosylase RlpA family protein [Helicobacteraceae bacterium]|jgi:rare lipoprotein A|nr:septal ring lytic transglycosylase RlpA family protein [Helicobacteraceae bacterium]